MRIRRPSSVWRTRRFGIDGGDHPFGDGALGDAPAPSRPSESSAGSTADLARLVRVVTRGLKRSQYRPGVLDGCLAATGPIFTLSAIRAPDNMN
ncbi:hypothetical protein [Sphaerisporangium sp. NPDC051011]|uniref:hypothetical protein n=1 Tax=Sphaerisporangium sp. NPDC051011 TaxID=3155792 RepID=UPI0033CE05F8